MKALIEAGWGPTIVAVTAAFVVALAGGLLTEIGPWYNDLRKPSWKPPDWAFGPIWTTILGLAVWAAISGWRNAPDSLARTVMVIAFTANSVLNILWSFLFFKLKRPDWAFLEVIVFWFSIVLLIVVLAGFSTLGCFLLAPYLIWVSIAAYLNRTIVRLNGPFG